MTVDVGRGDPGRVGEESAYPDRLFKALRDHGVGLPGARVLDLGTGSGSLGRPLARMGAVVVGMDPARNPRVDAGHLGAESTPAYRLVRGRAESLPFVDRSFDGVSAGRCWHAFDRTRALAEVGRVLAPEGWLTVAHVDWIPVAGGVAESTERLLRAYHPAWRRAEGGGVYSAWIPEILDAGFDDLETFCFDSRPSFTPRAWRSRARASAGEDGVLRAPELARFDQELASVLARRFPTEAFRVPHRVFALIARRPLRG